MNNRKFLWLMILSGLLLGSVCKRPYSSTKEARGLWVSRWEWAVPGASDPMTLQKQRITEIFDKAQQARLNFILFQIRGNGDAFYRSNYEPWSDLLTGELGRDPGWDPLAFAIDQAHQRGLELHVWINTFPAWRGTKPPLYTIPEQVYHAHPEWIVCDIDGKPMPLSQHYVNLSPGIPEVREYLLRVSMDIVRHYDIDGFHFDYIRYPEEANRLGYSHDAVSVRLFQSVQGNPRKLSWEDWQRENINQLVRSFYDEATDVKPWLKISAAVIGKYDVSDWNGYHIVFQDAKKWIAEGKMDFIVPMIYWQIDHPQAPFDDIVEDWYRMIRNRYIFPGMMINQLGENNWPVEEVIKQISIARDGGNGFVFFSYQGLERVLEQFRHRNDIHLANLPPMSWKVVRHPLDPQNLRANFLADGSVELIWSPPVILQDVHRYNIFRSVNSPLNNQNAENLLYVSSSADTTYCDRMVEPGRIYYYLITALDRVGNESPPSNELRVERPQHFLSMDHP